MLTFGAVFAGCASGPNGATSTSADPVDPSTAATPANGNVPVGSPTPTPSPAKGGPTLIQFALTVNPAGVIDSTNGFYNIVINSADTPIDPTNKETFTDFIQYDGTNTIWWNRETIPGSTIDFTFFPVAIINQDFSISDDGHTMFVTMKITDSTSPLNMFVNTNQFTADALTTDRQGLLGHVIDIMGPGLSDPPLYSYFCDKTLGVINPAPPNFPDDPLNDTQTINGQPDNFPYQNFDIASFTVTVH